MCVHPRWQTPSICSPDFLLEGFCKRCAVQLAVRLSLPVRSLESSNAVLALHMSAVETVLPVDMPA